MMMFNVGITRADNIQDQGNFLSSNAISRIQPDQMIIFNATSADTMDFLFDLGEANDEQRLEENINGVSEIIEQSNNSNTDNIFSGFYEIIEQSNNPGTSTIFIGFPEIIEQSNKSGNNNRTISGDIISISNLRISSEAISSPINSSIIDASHSVMRQTLDETNAN